MGCTQTQKKSASCYVKSKAIQYVRIAEPHLQVANLQIQLEENKTICHK